MPVTASTAASICRRPPRDGVAELIRVNPELNKIFIVTEKLSVHDSREIRAMGQQNGIDIFGGNSLGVADAWNEVRIGGALGGDSPAEALKKGSIAILSNSGNFTTTIATYLRMAGWGTTTAISSGKDIYIHYAAPEFAFALANDARSKAAVLYAEPGGHYELEASFNKPVVACVVGRWKAKLTRAVGHAGAMAGGDDDAGAKEQWFMAKFGVDGIFARRPGLLRPRRRGDQHRPHPGGADRGDAGERHPAGLRTEEAWRSSPGSPQPGHLLPPALDLPVVEAVAPYNEQIRQLNRQVGAVFPRQSLKDASGASQLDPKTQVATLHGVSMLDAAQYPLETNIALALVHEPGGENDRALVNVAVASSINLHGTIALAAAQGPRRRQRAQRGDGRRRLPGRPKADGAGTPRGAGPGRALLRAGLKDALDETFDASVTLDDETRSLLVGEAPDAGAEAMLAGLRERGGRSAFVRYLEGLDGHPTADAVLAAVTVTLAWGR